MPTKEVATAIKLMFDTTLTDRDNKVPALFSSENLPPEVIHFLASDHNAFDDNIFPFDELKGPFPNSSRMLFCPVMMMMMFPVCQSMMLQPIGRCQLPMMVKAREQLWSRHSFLVRSGWCVW
jgi:hypothetical protein